MSVCDLLGNYSVLMFVFHGYFDVGSNKIGGSRFSLARRVRHLRKNATKYFCYLYKSSFLDLCSTCL